MKAYWWTDGNNFGDMLSPELLEYATGTRPTLAGRDDTHKVLAVGSIMAVLREGDTVWGAGWHRNNQTTIHVPDGVRFLAVRGPLTREDLSLSWECPKVYGDPALLLPRLYPKEPKRLYRTWVPHMVDTRTGLEDNTVTLQQPWRTVVDGILESSFVLSSSLHGIVCAEAYGIPAAWVPHHRVIGGRFKFEDYLLGTGRRAEDLEPYKELPPIPNLEEIQDRLLEAAKKI